MYAYACLLHAHAYSKYGYAYNWAMFVGPIYAHAYSCPETLIQTILILFLYFSYIICLYFVLFYAFESASLLFALVDLHMLNKGFFSINSLIFHEHAYDMTIH